MWLLTSLHLPRPSVQVNARAAAKEDLAHALFHNVQPLHGVPWVSLFDRDRRFDLDVRYLLPLCKAQYSARLRSLTSESSPEVLSEVIQKSQRAVCFLHHARRPEIGFAPFYTFAYVCKSLMLAAHQCHAVLAAAYVYNTSMPTANHVVPCLPSFFASLSSSQVQLR
jgi:hypothetical protein